MQRKREVAKKCRINSSGGRWDTSWIGVSWREDHAMYKTAVGRDDSLSKKESGTDFKIVNF